MTSQTALASTRKTDELFPQKYSNGNAKTSNLPPVEKLTWEVIWLGSNLETRIFLLRWRIPCGTWLALASLIWKGRSEAVFNHLALDIAGIMRRVKRAVK